MSIARAFPYFPKKIRRQIAKNIESVLETRQLIMGPYAKKFEELFAKRIGVPYAVSLNSCTTALEISLRFLNLKGAEVLVPTNTFVASSNAVIYAGGKPVFVEIEPEHLNASFSDIQKKATSRTRAIIVVHLGGIVSHDFKKILAWAKQKKITVIEDCAHTLGDGRNKFQPGSQSFAGAFSFWPTKIITTGTGGMLTTSSKELADYAKSLRYHGLVSGNLREIRYLGNDWAMNEILACVGVGQMQALNGNLKRRRQVFKWYRQALSSFNEVSIPKPFLKEQASFYKFWINFNRKVDVFKLNDLMCKKYKVDTEFIYWPPVPLMPVYQQMKKFPWSKYPKSDAALRNHLCLPMHPMITRANVKTVVDSLKKALSEL